MSYPEHSVEGDPFGEDEEEPTEGPGANRTALPARVDEDVPAVDAPDVRLEVPTLHVDEINLEVEDLTAQVALSAEVLDLLKLNVGADVRLGRVQLDVKGVEAEAELEVRLRHVAAIVGRVLTTIDRNPQILEHVTRGVETATADLGSSAGTAVAELGHGAGEAVESVGEGTGEAVEATGEGAGQIARSAGKAVHTTADSTSRAVEDTAEGVVESADDAVDTAENELDDDPAGLDDDSTDGDEDLPEAEETAERDVEDAGRRGERRQPSRPTARTRREPGTNKSRAAGSVIDAAPGKHPRRSARAATAREAERSPGVGGRKSAGTHSPRATRGRPPQ
ncbi:hypothetical protein JGS22_004070 [Streptomyces sp. P38-E01]|uniref:Uncharacterized protein n=1 Tax=Streptomyces tardus TaxID=2780544 RepID=A0A949JD59_9ACTN|nr:hypothetical protein [Streptomyces tardus]MBU7596833.1 hypothetical protein [Streptomyces tardus]